MAKPTDQKLLTYLCTKFNPDGTTTTLRTLTVGDRTILFHPDGEIWKIVFSLDGVEHTVYP